MTKITFIEADGKSIEATAEPGMTVMQVAVNAGIAAIAAECGGACACGTCHCYINKEWFDKIMPAKEDETDMLDFVIDPTETSRLSCQIEVTPDMDGIIINIPASQT
ncbi:2Fe-2S iron-sulfur cluster-binding protein [Yoonia sp. MH D7]